MIYTCPICGVQHDYSTRHGLIQTIAHIHYEYFKSLGLTQSPQSNWNYAEGVVQWFEGEWTDNYDYFDELNRQDCERYEKYYIAYSNGKITSGA